MTPKRIKYLGINLATEVKCFYMENYEKLLKEIGDLNREENEETEFQMGGFIWVGENVLKLDRGDVCTALRMY